MKEGDYVHYAPGYGKKENGRIKSIKEDGTGAFVVYHCAGEWERYKDYTGALTDLSDLHMGWVDEKGSLIPETLNHIDAQPIKP